MSDKQKTAVQYLKEQLKMILPMNQFNDVVVQDAFNLANELFKQQIIEAYEQGDNNGAERVYYNSDRDDISGGQYFNETFKTERNGK